MPIATECPLCATKGQVPNAISGKRVKCPKCCNLFVVTGPTQASALGNQKLSDSALGKLKAAGSFAMWNSQIRITFYPDSIYLRMRSRRRFVIATKIACIA